MRTDREYQIKLRGNVPEKQLAKAYVQSSYTTAQSLTEFLQMLQAEGFSPYYRNNQLAGIYKSRKYRFKTLGITLDKLKEIEHRQGIER